jgi:DNA-binding transcriptional LysR family regulator
MKLGALPTLQVVLRRGSFALAAQELGLTPSAVSQQMRSLEEYFGQPLFNRSGRTVKPTPLANEVVGTVQGALGNLERLRDRSRFDVRGRLRVGAANTVQLSALPRALKYMQERYPGIQVVLEPENASEHLLEKLKAGNIEAAIVARPEAGVSRAVECEEISDEPFVFVYPRNYAGPGNLKEIIVNLPWIRYNLKLSGGKTASKFVRELSPGLEPRFEMMSSFAVLSMVSEGLGFSVIPQPKEPLCSIYPVEIIRLDRQMRKRHIVVARRKTDIDNRRINALRDCLRDAYGSGRVS